MARFNETNVKRGVKIRSHGACRALRAQRTEKGRLSQSKTLMDMQGNKAKELLDPWMSTRLNWRFFCLFFKVTLSCLTLWDPMDCSLPGSSTHGILQAKILEWVDTPISRGSFQHRDRTQVSHIAGGFFTSWATMEAQIELGQFSSVQSLSRVQLFVTAWTSAHQASLSITNSWSLLKLMSIMSVMPSNHLTLCCHLLLLPSIFSSIRGFSNESVLHIRWPKYWRFGFSISSSYEYSGLISFKINWLDLLAVQGTLKSLLQHHISKASILQGSAFFVVQLSHPYMTTRKTIAL